MTILIIETNAQGCNPERACPKISSGDSVYAFITLMSRDQCKPLPWMVEARNKRCCVIFIVNHSAPLKCNRELLWSHKQWGWHQSAGGIDVFVHCFELVTSMDVLADQLYRTQSSMLMSCPQSSLLKSFPNISVRSSLSYLLKHDVSVGWRW